MMGLKRCLFQVVHMDLPTIWSKKLANWIGPKDFIAVYSPDVYFLTVSDCPTLFSFEQKMESLYEHAAGSYHMGKSSIELEIACGIAKYPDHGKSPQALIRNTCIAKNALSHAKDVRYQLYDPQMYTSLMREKSLLRSIPKAIADGELELYYQPQVCIATDRIVGAEALIRWNSPEFGFVPPDEFVPLMEQNGLIEMLGKHVIHESVAFLKKHRDVLAKMDVPFQVAINLTAGELMDQSIVGAIQEELALGEVPPAFLAVEITERTFMEDFQKVNTTLKELQNLGITIAIDDFGTGFSSLGYLMELHVNKIKIDRTFIKNYPHADAGVLAKAIIRMAHELHMLVIAEGVELEPQRSFLATAGCDQYQGYFCSKAIPAAEFIALLTSHGAATS